MQRYFKELKKLSGSAQRGIRRKLAGVLSFALLLSCLGGGLFPVAGADAGEGQWETSLWLVSSGAVGPNAATQAASSLGLDDTNALIDNMSLAVTAGNDGSKRAVSMKLEFSMKKGEDGSSGPELGQEALSEEDTAAWVKARSPEERLAILDKPEYHTALPEITLTLGLNLDGLSIPTFQSMDFITDISESGRSSQAVTLGSIIVDSGASTITYRFNRLIYAYSDIAGSCEIAFLEADGGDVKNMNPGIRWVETGRIGLTADSSTQQGGEVPSAAQYTVTTTAVAAFPKVTYTIELAASEGHNLNGVILVNSIPDKVLPIAVSRAGCNWRVETTSQSFYFGENGEQLPSETATSSSLRLTRRAQFGGLSSFIYTFGITSEAAATFVLEAELYWEEYRKYLNMSEDASLELSFDNHVRCYASKEDQKEDRFAASAYCTVVFQEAPFFGKEGTLAGANGTTFQWVLDVNSYLKPVLENKERCQFYIVDYISNQSHRYATSAGIQLYEGLSASADPGGAATPIESFGAGDIVEYSAGDNIWNSVTAAGIEEGKPIPYENVSCANLAGLTQDGTKIAVYETTVNSVTGSVMVIPVSHGSIKNPFRAVYKTVIQTSHVGNNVSQLELPNKAKLLWDNFYYGSSGSNNSLEGGMELDKPVTAYMAVVQKSGGGYDQQTQELTWKFVVNQLGATIGAIEIVDEFDDAKQLLQVTSTGGITLEKEDMASGGTGPEYIAPSEWENKISTLNGTSESKFFYYTVADKKDSNGSVTGKQLRIYLTNIAADKLRSFTFKTRLADETFLSREIKKGVGGSDTNSVTNTSKVSVTGTAVSGEALDSHFEVTGKQPIENTWLAKEAVGSFDYSEYAFKWRITFNPNRLRVGSNNQDDLKIELTDVLPEGMDLKQVTAVQLIGGTGGMPPDGVASVTNVTGSAGNTLQGTATWKDGLSLNWKVVSGAAGGKEVQMALRRTPATTDDPLLVTDNTLVIELETFYPEESRHKAEWFKTEETKQTNTVTASPYFIHELTKAPCEVKNASGTAGLMAQAVNSHTSPPAKKVGTYHPIGTYIYADGTKDKVAYIEWKLDINLNQIRADGYSVSDLWGEEAGFGNGYLLDIGSVKLYPLEIASDGSIKAGTEIDFEKETAFKTAFSLSENGVEFRVPSGTGIDGEDYAQKSYRIQFHTILTEDLGSRDMVNQFKWADASGEGAFQENSGNAQSAGDFSQAAAIKASERKSVQVKASSVYTVQTDQGTGKKMDEYYTLSGAQYVLTEYALENGRLEEKSEKKKTTPGGQGISTTLFLKDRTLYKVEETAPPAGYRLPENPVFYLYTGTTTPGNDILAALPQGATVRWYGTANDSVERSLQSKLFRFYFLHEPEGSLSFQKVVDEGGRDTGLSGITFQAKDTHDQLDYSKAAKSGPGGIVEITGLEPGVTYKLKEPKVQGYQEWGAGSLEVTPSYTKDGGYAYVVKDKTGSNVLGLQAGNELTVSGGTPFAVKNTRLTGSSIIAGNKTDTAGKPLPGAQMGLYTVSGSSTASPEAILYATVSSGADGSFRFEEVAAGEYEIREIKAPSGYDTDTSQSFQVAITDPAAPVTTDTAGNPIVFKNKKSAADDSGSGSGGGGFYPPPEKEEADPENPDEPEGGEADDGTGEQDGDSGDTGSQDGQGGDSGDTGSQDDQDGDSSGAGNQGEQGSGSQDPPDGTSSTNTVDHVTEGAAVPIVIKTNPQTGETYPVLGITDGIQGVEYTFYNRGGNEVGKRRTDRDGNLDVSDFPDGEYLILESEVPLGYAPSGGAYSLTIRREDGELILDATRIPQGAAWFGDLEQTGAAKAWPFLLGGTIFLLLAAALAFSRRRISHR